MSPFRVGPEIIDNTVAGDGKQPCRESSFVAAVLREICQRFFEDDRGQVLRRLLVVDLVMDVGEDLRHKLVVELRQNISLFEGLRMLAG